MLDIEQVNLELYSFIHSFYQPNIMFGFRILCAEICDQSREHKDSQEDMVNDLKV